MTYYVGTPNITQTLEFTIQQVLGCGDRTYSLTPSYTWIGKFSTSTWWAWD